VLAGDSWWQIAVAVLLAAVFAQLSFLGHDAGHRQIFATRRSNYALGVACGNLAIGLSYGWWCPSTTGTTPTPTPRAKIPTS
jgi:fatty acid desaturase